MSREMIEKMLDYQKQWEELMLNIDLSDGQRNIDHGFCILDPPEDLRIYIETHEGRLPSEHLDPYVKLLKCLNTENIHDYVYFKDYKKYQKYESHGYAEDFDFIYEYSQGLLVYSKLPTFIIPDYFWKFYFEQYPNYEFVSLSDKHYTGTGFCPDEHMKTHVINIQYYMIIFTSTYIVISMNVCPSDVDNYGKLAVFFQLDEDSYCKHFMAVEHDVNGRRIFKRLLDEMPWDIPDDELDDEEILKKDCKNVSNLLASLLDGKPLVTVQ